MFLSGRVSVQKTFQRIVHIGIDRIPIDTLVHVFERGKLVQTHIARIRQIRTSVKI